MYCPNCGLQIQDGIKFCPHCGTPIAPVSAEPQPKPVPQPEPEPIPQPQPEPEPVPQSQPEPQPIPQPEPVVEHPVEEEEEETPNSMEKTLALEAYLGILVLAPLFGAKQSKFARFHANQGIVLFAISLAMSLLIFFNSIVSVAADVIAISVILGLFSGLYSLVSLGVLAFSIIGIISVLKGKKKVLPLIGKIKILKEK